MSKLVYVAGPYTNPDPIVNTNQAIVVADHIYEASEQFLVPVIPHLSLLWHMVKPHEDVNFWYNYDIELLARCDALYRFEGDSSGADNEVKEMLLLNRPVFYDLAHLFAWGRKQQRLYD